MILEGQRTNPLARDGENSIAHRRGNPPKSFFADPDNRFVRRADKMDSYFRHFRRNREFRLIPGTCENSPVRYLFHAKQFK